MNVIWMEQAYESLYTTIEYVDSEFGEQASDKLKKEAFHIGNF